jgi:hypothetical protein
MAEPVFEHVYKLHGLPKYIVSDCDSLFMSIFWKRLHELIGVKLKHITPRWMEAQNVLIEPLLKCFGNALGQSRKIGQAKFLPLSSL